MELGEAGICYTHLMQNIKKNIEIPVFLCFFTTLYIPNLTVCSCHVTYLFQSESTLYSIVA